MAQTPTTVAHLFIPIILNMRTNPQNLREKQLMPRPLPWQPDYLSACRILETALQTEPLHSQGKIDEVWVVVPAKEDGGGMNDETHNG